MDNLFEFMKTIVREQTAHLTNKGERMEPIRPNAKGIFPSVLTNVLLPVALGNFTQYRILVAPTSRGVFVSVDGVGAYEFSGFAHWGYVMEKIKLKHDGDATNLADFINDQLGFCYPRQGRYAAQLCAEVL